MLKLQIVRAIITVIFIMCAEKRSEDDKAMMHYNAMLITINSWLLNRPDFFFKLDGQILVSGQALTERKWYCKVPWVLVSSNDL